MFKNKTLHYFGGELTWLSKSRCTLIDINLKRSQFNWLRILYSINSIFKRRMRTKFTLKSSVKFHMKFQRRPNCFLFLSLYKLFQSGAKSDIFHTSFTNKIDNKLSIFQVSNTNTSIDVNTVHCLWRAISVKEIH